MGAAFTEAERKDIRSYQVGDVVRFAREYKKLGIAKGEYLAVESVDRQYNLVWIKGAGEKRVDWQPWLKHCSEFDSTRPSDPIP